MWLNISVEYVCSCAVSFNSHFYCDGMTVEYFCNDVEYVVHRVECFMFFDVPGCCLILMPLVKKKYWSSIPM